MSVKLILNYSFCTYLASKLSKMYALTDIYHISQTFMSISYYSLAPFKFAVFLSSIWYLDLMMRTISMIMIYYKGAIIYFYFSNSKTRLNYSNLW